MIFHCIKYFRQFWQRKNNRPFTIKISNFFINLYSSYSTLNKTAFLYQFYKWSLLQSRDFIIKTRKSLYKISDVSVQVLSCPNIQIITSLCRLICGESIQQNSNMTNSSLINPIQCYWNLQYCITLLKLILSVVFNDDCPPGIRVYVYKDIPEFIFPSLRILSERRSSLSYNCQHETTVI